MSWLRVDDSTVEFGDAGGGEAPEVVVGEGIVVDGVGDADSLRELVEALVEESHGRDVASGCAAEKRCVNEPEPVLDLRRDLTRNPRRGDGVPEDVSDGVVPVFSNVLDNFLEVGGAIEEGFSDLDL